MFQFNSTCFLFLFLVFLVSGIFEFMYRIEVDGCLSLDFIFYFIFICFGDLIESSVELKLVVLDCGWAFLVC